MTIPSPLIPIFVALFAFCTPFSIAGAHISLGVAVLLLALDDKSRAAAARLALAHLLVAPVALWCAANVVAAAFAIDRAASAGKLDKLALLMLLPLGALPQVRRALPHVLGTLVVSSSVVSAWGLARHIAAGGGVEERVRGIGGFYMTVAGILMIVALVACAVAAAAARDGRRRLAGALALAGALVGAALVGTYTRGSWLGFAAGAALLARRRRALLAVAVAAIVAAFAFGPPALRDRALSIFEPSLPRNAERALIWRHGLGLLRARPWTGVGQVIPAALMEREVVRPDGAVLRVHSHMHNAYLQIAVSMGLPALAAFAFLIATFFRVAARAARAVRAGPCSPWERGLAAAYPALLVALLVNGLVEWNFGDSEILGLFYLVSGLVIGIDGGTEAAPAAATDRAA